VTPVPQQRRDGGDHVSPGGSDFWRPSGPCTLRLGRVLGGIAEEALAAPGRHGHLAPTPAVAALEMGAKQCGLLVAALFA